jgi:hypothetical protein
MENYEQLNNWRSRFDIVHTGIKNGMIRVEHNSRTGMVDEAGNIVIPLEYDYVGYNHDGKVRVSKNNKWGFYDIATNSVDLKYDWLGVFTVSNERAFFFIGDVEGHIDRDGKEYYTFENRTKLRADKVKRFLGSSKKA